MFILAVAWIILFAFFGASLASFLGVVAERGVRDESLTARSHCICGRKLKMTENIPVLGWLMAAGRAKCCEAKIPLFLLYTETLAFIFWAGFGFVSLGFLEKRINLPTMLFAVSASFFILMLESLYLHFIVARLSRHDSNADIDG